MRRAQRLLSVAILSVAILSVAILSVMALPGSALAAKPSVYLEVRGVKEPPGTAPSLREQAKALFIAALKKHPEVVTDLGTPAPQGDKLAQALAERRLMGYASVLRITKVKHELQPPPPGKVYKVLMVEVEVAIDAEKIPSGQMALAGEGSAQVGTEVSRVKDQERIQLTREALEEAVNQATDRSVAKLSGGPQKSKQSRHAKSGRKKTPR